MLRSIGKFSLRQVWTALWMDWASTVAVSLAIAIYVGMKLSAHNLAGFAMGAVVLLSGPVAFMRLYSRGMNAVIAGLFGAFCIVALAACEVMFLKVGG
jgi:hypothetical protein